MDQGDLAVSETRWMSNFKKNDTIVLPTIKMPIEYGRFVRSQAARLGANLEGPALPWMRSRPSIHIEASTCVQWKSSNHSHLSRNNADRNGTSFSWAERLSLCCTLNQELVRPAASQVREFGECPIRYCPISLRACSNDSTWREILTSQARFRYNQLDPPSWTYLSNSSSSRQPEGKGDGCSGYLYIICAG